MRTCSTNLKILDFHKEAKSSKMSKKNTVTFWNGQTMPLIGLGTEKSSDEEVKKAINWALECGYRHIDTAYMYRNEKAIGEVLKEWFDSGKIKREELFITTKLPFVGNHPSKVGHFLQLSLKNLQLDYVNLYLIHFPVGLIGQNDDDLCPKDENGGLVLNPNTDLIKIWLEMEEQIKSGRTKAIGLSNFNSQQIEKIVQACKCKPVNLQVEVHAYFQQKELRQFCKKNEITVCAYAPLGSKDRADKCVECATPHPDIPNVLDDPVVREIAGNHKKTPAQVLLRHLVQQDIAVIPRATSNSQIAENINIFDFELSDADMKRLNELDKNQRTFDFHEFPGLSVHPEYPFRVAF